MPGGGDLVMGWMLLALIGLTLIVSGAKLESPAVVGFGALFSTVAIVGAVIELRRGRRS